MQVILNADDFGRSASINWAVIEAHRHGVLTSASLMVAGEAAEEAVALARSAPTLAVGLHVVVAAGRPALPPEQIPHLVDDTGRLPDNPVLAGLRYVSSPAARRELALELEAQFERFAATGLPLSHVDSHLHMHVHPTVFGQLLPLAVRYGARGIRLPRDDFWLAMRHDRHRAATKAVWSITFGLLGRRCWNQLGGNHLTTTHRVYGLMQTGQMQEEYVLSVLHSLQVPTAELYFHPSTSRQGQGLGPNPDDLATLLSPAVRRLIEQRGLRLATYSTLDGE